MAENHPPIIIIDDEPGVGMIFSKIFEEWNFSIRHFSNAEEAVSYVQSNPSVEIIFLDIRLPGMDGIAALSKLMAIDPSLHVVMMTAYQTVESVIKAMKSGAVDYLVKPLDPDMAIQAVKKYGFSKVGRQPLGGAYQSYLADNPPTIPEFIAHTPSMKSILTVAEKYSMSDENVLILGESGTGKELLAHYVHEKSSRKQKPFIVVDCASIPESLFESELFGYEKGAFTGADTPKVGRFESANGGTLFLDEIGNIPLTMQAKLLRFTEDRTIFRLGRKKPIVLNVRLITATNVDLKTAVQKGGFREDLFYRLSTLTVHLPPLRNRTGEEKEHLVKCFLERHSRKLKRSQITLSESALKLIVNYPWPGNVREMENALYSAVLLCDSNHLDVKHFPIGIQSHFSHKRPSSQMSENRERNLRKILKKVERDEILAALDQAKGNKMKASKILSMDYKTFLMRLKEYTESD